MKNNILRIISLLLIVLLLPFGAFALDGDQEALPLDKNTFIVDDDFSSYQNGKNVSAEINGISYTAVIGENAFSSLSIDEFVLENANIYVLPGEYSSNASFSKSVNLYGANYNKSPIENTFENNSILKNEITITDDCLISGFVLDGFKISSPKTVSLKGNEIINTPVYIDATRVVATTNKVNKILNIGVSFDLNKSYYISNNEFNDDLTFNVQSVLQEPKTLVSAVIIDNAFNSSDLNLDNSENINNHLTYNVLNNIFTGGKINLNGSKNESATKVAYNITDNIFIDSENILNVLCQLGFNVDAKYNYHFSNGTYIKPTFISQTSKSVDVSKYYIDLDLSNTNTGSYANDVAASIKELISLFKGYNIYDYSLDNSSKLINALSNAVSNLKDASSDYLNTALKYEGIALLTGVNNIEKEKLVSSIALAKEEIINAFNSYDESEYDSSSYADLTAIKDNALSSLNSAISISDVDSIKETALNDMENAPKARTYDISVYTTTGGTFTRDVENPVASNVTLTLTAIANAGYLFDGWYENTTLVSSDAVYSFKPTKSTTLHPVFKNNSFNLSLTPSGSGYIMIGEKAVKSASTLSGYYGGQKVTMVATESKGKFLYWYDNKIGRIVSYDPEYTIIFSNDANFEAVFSSQLTSFKHITYVSDNGTILKSRDIRINETLEPPTTKPKSPGKTFIGWSKSTDEILNDPNHLIVQALFSIDEIYYNVNITNGYAKGNKGTNENEDKFMQLSQVVLYPDDAPEGMKFSHWEDQNNNIISYYQNYNFYVTGDITLNAVYINKSDKIITAPNINIVSSSANSSTRKISFVAQRSVPCAYNLSAHGIILTSQSSIAENENTFVIGSENVLVGTSVKSGRNGTYVLTKNSVSSGQTWYARGYLTYVDSNGIIKTIYSSVVSNSF